MKYQEFIENKKHLKINYGIDHNYVPIFLFDFQAHVLKWAVKKGRGAIFLDTGLGKTLIELCLAKNYLSQGKPVLILTPLAVAFQFIKECERFGISDISYSKDGSIKSSIVLCNYERIDKLDPKDFDCVILDESSIIKNFDGAIKSKVTQFLRSVKYRFLFTATPSPNDFVELGTSSEALGYMGYMDMLSKYFSNNEKTIKAMNIHNKFYLKPHAQNAFFDWVSSWAISMRKPSDLGFSDDKFILPELITNTHFVKNNQNWIIDGQVMMFSHQAQTLPHVRQEQKMTIKERCEKAVELAKDKCSVYWVNFNDESKLIKDLDNDCFEIKGSMPLDKKEEYLLAFSSGEIKRLVTKPKITSFGLNWQHCNHTVYFPTFSFEQYYQAIRRFWRFGQKNIVTCDLVLSDGQKKVIKALDDKMKKSNKLFTKLSNATNNIENKQEINYQKLKLPKW